MINDFEIDGDVSYIFIQRKNGDKFTVTIDTEVLQTLRKVSRSWYINEYRPGVFRVQGRLEGSKSVVMLHRIILPDVELIDHKNGNALDNRRDNLRSADKSINAQNMGVRADNTSGERGISWNTDKRKWRAAVHTNGKNHHVGYFSDKTLAIKAVREARAKLLPFCPPDQLPQPKEQTPA